MRLLLQALMIASMLCGLAACGNKGKLKSPSQIQAAEAKKAKKEAKEKDDAGDDADQSSPANALNHPLPNPPPQAGEGEVEIPPQAGEGK